MLSDIESPCTPSSRDELVVKMWNNTDVAKIFILFLFYINIIKVISLKKVYQAVTLGCFGLVV